MKDTTESTTDPVQLELDSPQVRRNALLVLAFTGVLFASTVWVVLALGGTWWAAIPVGLAAPALAYVVFYVLFAASAYRSVPNLTDEVELAADGTGNCVPGPAYDATQPGVGFEDVACEFCGEPFTRVAGSTKNACEWCWAARAAEETEPTA